MQLDCTCKENVRNKSKPLDRLSHTHSNRGMDFESTLQIHMKRIKHGHENEYTVDPFNVLIIDTNKTDHQSMS